ncbi:MAG: DUF3575 domain-containing protein [Paramuribaculum sp.]|nr:DUF3575 domain-containing protein [Paramuribaculum sp.]MDE6488895.1 DUF3575 domain-containing protein [Paramuribaculum sp.]
MKQLIIILCAIVSAHTLSARKLTDSVTVFFPVSETGIYENYMDNRTRLDSFARNLDSLGLNPCNKLHKIEVWATASPEGSYMFNRNLSDGRAKSMISWLADRLSFPDSIATISNTVRNWTGLRSAVSADSLIPDRNTVIDLLAEYLSARHDTSVASNRLLHSLRTIDNGLPYRYMLADIFPSLREATIRVTYDRVSCHLPRMAGRIAHAPPSFSDTGSLADGSSFRTPPSTPPHNAKWALRTNLLYDALAVPDIGAELYLGRNISLQCEWMYAWWSHRVRNFFWRIYGGDIGLRWWFGKTARRQHLSGHHIGIYAQTLIWDFELGRRGYMGGQPGAAIWDRANYGCGIEYGYSMPLAKHFNIDFCIGIGYIGGVCREYLPQCGHYVWQSTKNLNYIGPTKTEISLVYIF